jgi:hypothetical protein
MSYFPGFPGPEQVPRLVNHHRCEERVGDVIRQADLVDPQVMPAQRSRRELPCSPTAPGNLGRRARSSLTAFKCAR